MCFFWMVGCSETGPPTTGQAQHNEQASKAGQNFWMARIEIAFFSGWLLRVSKWSEAHFNGVWICFEQKRRVWSLEVCLICGCPAWCKTDGQILQRSQNNQPVSVQSLLTNNKATPFFLRAGRRFLFFVVFFFEIAADWQRATDRQQIN